VQPEQSELLQALQVLRVRLREANRARGRTSLTLHMTRLERDKARAQARTAQAEVEPHAAYGREMCYRLMELFEVTRPGTPRGDFEDDYKRTVAEVRRLRSLGIVAELEDRDTHPLTAEYPLVEHGDDAR